MLVDGAHPQHWVDATKLPLADIGDFAIALGDLVASMALIEEQAQKIEHLVALGGDHSVTLPLLRALSKRRGPSALVHLDAHVDTWPDSFGQPYGHGSVFYNAIEEGLIDPRRMVQIGIRSPVSREVHDWTAVRGVVTIKAHDVHEAGPAAIAGRIAEVVGDAPVSQHGYRRARPGVCARHGNPRDRRTCKLASAGDLAACSRSGFSVWDLVEVAPAYDVAEITALAGATMVWEYICLLGLRR